MRRMLLLMISAMFFTSAQPVSAKDISARSMQDFVLVFLDQAMSQSVNGYYGKPRMYDLYDAKIVEMKPLNNGNRFSSEIKVLVKTYVGPHNPPYGLETITLTNDFAKIKVIRFEHKDLISIPKD